MLVIVWTRTMVRFALGGQCPWAWRLNAAHQSAVSVSITPGHRCIHDWLDTSLIAGSSRCASVGAL